MLCFSAKLQSLNIFKKKKNMNTYLEIISEQEWKRLDESRNVMTFQQKQTPKITKSHKKFHKSVKNFKKRKSRYHWRADENLRYCEFLRNNLAVCKLTKKQKALEKFNVKMSKAVKTKTPTQCRSHHQKMLIKYETYENIIDGLEKLYNGVSEVKKSCQIIEMNEEELHEYWNSQGPSIEAILQGIDSQMEDIFGFQQKDRIFGQI